MAKTTNDSETVSLVEAARLLQCSERTIHRLIASGELRSSVVATPITVIRHLRHVALVDVLAQRSQREA